jgi:hypothetical protein
VLRIFEAAWCEELVTETSRNDGAGLDEKRKPRTVFADEEPHPSRAPAHCRAADRGEALLPWNLVAPGAE